MHYLQEVQANIHLRRHILAKQVLMCFATKLFKICVEVPNFTRNGFLATFVWPFSLLPHFLVIFFVPTLSFRPRFLEITHGMYTCHRTLQVRVRVLVPELLYTHTPLFRYFSLCSVSTCTSQHGTLLQVLIFRLTAHEV